MKGAQWLDKEVLTLPLGAWGIGLLCGLIVAVGIALSSGCRSKRSQPQSAETQKSQMRASDIQRLQEAVERVTRVQEVTRESNTQEHEMLRQVRVELRKLSERVLILENRK